MTHSPPDIASLSLSSQPRLHDTYDYEGTNGARPQYHFATSPGLPVQSQYNPLTTGQSPLKKSTRGALPSQWLDSAPEGRPLSPQNSSEFSSTGGSPPMPTINPPIGSSGLGPLDDDIIPTAIVIKNIPFNVKRETLLDIITSLSIPTPYAFNYHLDQQGQFRGLAFANFRQPQDADAVVVALNGFDVQGRKLRVEYKKVLQASEKERIEREKALRRMRSMHLDKEQSTPTYDDYPQASANSMATMSSLGTAYTPQRSVSSSSYHQQQQYSPPNISSMPSAQFNNHPLASAPLPSHPPVSATPSIAEKATSNELDLNDPATLEIYSRILLFKDDRMRDELAFSRTLSPRQRRIVHLLAQKLGVYHYSVGEGEDRYVVVTRIDPQRQQQQVPHTLSRAPSSYLGQSASPAAAALRVKKSMPDMKTLHSQAPRLMSRASNGNIREGFATLSTPARRSSTFGSLFGSSSPFSPGNSVPPVPALPSGSPMNGHESPSGVVRQPRGPGVGGFTRRDSRVGLNESARGGFDARTYEPLEI